jgi:hypothetical protein
MSLLRSLIALDRIRRFTLAATCMACSVLCFLSGCIDHSFGRPYSGTASLLRTGGNPPWSCYGGAPTKTSAFVEDVGYSTAFACVVVANAIGETLILPVDLVAKPSEARPLPPQPSCGAQPLHPQPPHEQETPHPPPSSDARDASAHELEAVPLSSGRCETRAVAS